MTAAANRAWSAARAAISVRILSGISIMTRQDRRRRPGSGRAGSLSDGHRRRRRLAGQDDIIGIAEHEHLRRAPDDPFQLHHRSHPQPKLPQQQVLNEVPGDAPGPERQPPVADRTEAEPAQLENEKVGAEKIVAPILEEGGDVAVVLLPTTMIERSRRTDQQASPRLERLPASGQASAQVLGVADRFQRVDRIETFAREVEAVEIGDDNADATVELLELPSANLSLHGGIGHAHDFDAAATGKVVGRCPRSASQIQKAHAIRRPEQDTFGVVRPRERRAWKNARAVIVSLAAIATEHVVVGAILVVVLEKVGGLRRPLDELPLFEFIQRMTDIAGVPRMGDEQKEHVMKQVIGREQPDNDHRQYQDDIHALLLWRSGLAGRARPRGDTGDARSVARSRDDFRCAALDFIHPVDWKYDGSSAVLTGEGLIRPGQTNYDGACARYRWERGELSRCA